MCEIPERGGQQIPLPEKAKIIKAVDCSTINTNEPKRKCSDFWTS